MRKAMKIAIALLVISTFICSVNGRFRGPRIKSRPSRIKSTATSGARTYSSNPYQFAGELIAESLNLYPYQENESVEPQPKQKNKTPSWFTSSTMWDAIRLSMYSLNFYRERMEIEVNKEHYLHGLHEEVEYLFENLITELNVRSIVFSQKIVDLVNKNDTDTTAVIQKAISTAFDDVFHILDQYNGEIKELKVKYGYNPELATTISNTSASEEFDSEESSGNSAESNSEDRKVEKEKRKLDKDEKTEKEEKDLKGEQSVKGEKTENEEKPEKEKTSEKEKDVKRDEVSVVIKSYEDDKVIVKIPGNDKVIQTDNDGNIHYAGNQKTADINENIDKDEKGVITRSVERESSATTTLVSNVKDAMNNATPGVKSVAKQSIESAKWRTEEIAGFVGGGVVLAGTAIISFIKFGLPLIKRAGFVGAGTAVPLSSFATNVASSSRAAQFANTDGAIELTFVNVANLAPTQILVFARDAILHSRIIRAGGQRLLGLITMFIGLMISAFMNFTRTSDANTLAIPDA